MIPLTRSLRRVLGLLADSKADVAVLSALMAAGAFLEITVPFLTQRLIDALLRSFSGGPRPPVFLLQCGAGILIATVLVRATRSIYNYRLFRLVTRTEDRVRQRAFAAYLAMDTRFHHSATSGQIIGRIDAGSAAVFSVLFDICGQNLLPPLVVIAGVFAALAAKNVWIALAVLVPAPLYVGIVLRLTRRIYDIEQEGCTRFEELAKEVYDVAANALTVKKFAQEQTEVRLQARLQERARETQYRGERLWAVVENCQSLIATLGRVAVIVMAGLLVLWRKATVGEFVLFVSLQDMAYQPVSQLSILFPRLRRALSRADRLFGVLEQRPGIVDSADARAIEPLAGSIEFEGVWFRYSDEQPWILEDVNVLIPAGVSVALVGPSGSGKTTFINLLQRLYEPSRGSIRIDGVDIREATQASLRRQIAVVPQEVDLFSRTIEQNIRYGKPEASPGEVEDAARAAMAHEFILRSEDGYETLVGERGLKLSGGERQRIGIARALLKDPRILILDEATSHLDAESERRIQKATEAAVAGRTSLLIAHRLTTVMNADLVIVFNHRGIEGMGTHAEMRDFSPTYRRLYAAHERSLAAGKTSRSRRQSEVALIS
jgi:ABC-type multidrug transport system fused ATPase/permease subunit